MDLTVRLDPEVRNHPHVQLSDKVRSLDAATCVLMIMVQISGRSNVPGGSPHLFGALSLM
jgi:hypothetical protein